MLINNQAFCSVSRNLTTSISDHLPQLIIVEHFKELYETNKVKVSYRNFEKFNEKCFNKESKSIDWSLATENDDLDLGFRTFFHLFNKTLDKHAP